MKGKSYENKLHGSIFNKSRPQKIKRNYVFRMQNVKTYAAAIGSKNGICQKMVEINEHRRKKYQPVAFPVIFIVPIRDGTDEDEVEEVMNYRLYQRFKV